MTGLYTAAGYLIYQAHHFIQWTGRIYRDAVLPQMEDRDPQPDAWGEFQARCAELRQKARERHAPTRHIDDQQRATINAALAGVRKGAA